MSNIEINLPRFVRFEENRLLTADALDEASRARAGRRHLHNRWCHGYGIVCGLELLPRKGSLVIRKGLAFDAEGRELMFCEDYCGKLALGDDQSRDLWLTAPSSGATWEPEVLVLPARKIPRDRPWTHGLSAVFLGMVTGSALEVNRSGVVFAYASAARVTSPTGAAQMRIGPESAEDPRRFAIFVRRHENLEEAFRIDTDGRAHLFMDAEVRNDEAASAKSESAANAILLGQSDSHEGNGVMLAFQKGDAPPPEAPRSWSIYAAKDKDKKLEDLRIEIFNPGKEGSPQLQQFTLCVDAEKLLVVGADKQVTVHGLLDVVGAFVSQAGKPDPVQSATTEPEVGGPIGIHVARPVEHPLGTPGNPIRTATFAIEVFNPDAANGPIMDVEVSVTVLAQLIQGALVEQTERPPTHTLRLAQPLVARHAWNEAFTVAMASVTQYSVNVSARGLLASGKRAQGESTFTLKPQT